MKISYFGLFVFGSTLAFPIKSAQFSVFAEIVGYLIFGLLLLSFSVCFDLAVTTVNQVGRKDLREMAHIPAISAIAAMCVLVVMKSLIYGDFLSQKACFVLCGVHLFFSVILYFASWGEK